MVYWPGEVGAVWLMCGCLDHIAAIARHALVMYSRVHKYTSTRSTYCMTDPEQRWYVAVMSNEE